MKRIFLTAISFLLVLPLLFGCSNNKQVSGSSSSIAAPQENIIATVNEEKIKSDFFGFSVDIPASWAYVPANSFEDADDYIFAIQNTENGANVTAFHTADYPYETPSTSFWLLENAASNFTSLGFETTIADAVKTNIGGRDCHRFDLTAENEQVSIAQSFYFVQTTTATNDSICIATAMQNNHGNAEIDAILESFMWQ